MTAIASSPRSGAPPQRRVGADRSRRPWLDFVAVPSRPSPCCSRSSSSCSRPSSRRPRSTPTRRRSSPAHWTLDNFTRIFTELPFARLILNSFVFAGGVTVFALVFDSLAAYALARLDFRGSRMLLIAIVASLMIPFQATLIPIYQLVSDLGWVNTFAGLIAPRAADAFGIFFLRQFFLVAAARPRQRGAHRRGVASSGSSGASCCRTPCPRCSPSASSSSSTTGTTCSGRWCSPPTRRWAPSPPGSPC